MPNHLIVISIDSLFDDDMPFLRTLPNFGRLFQRGASYCQNGMRSVYPTLTYPVHASIITGVYPARHGIFHNEKLDVGNLRPEWYWHYKDLKAETVIDVAKKAGLSTCVVGWPVMAGCPSADYLVPEIWPQGENADPRPVFAPCSSASVSDILERHFHKIRRMRQPYLDMFMVGCAADIIRRHKPDVLFMHLAHLDHARHDNGLTGQMVEQAVLSNDDWLGRIMEAAMDAGIYDKTNFVILSDHGHLPVKHLFNPNVLLVEKGLISVDAHGKIQGWKAWCNSAALSCQVVMREPGDGKTRKILEDLLSGMRRESQYGVESVFTKEEARQEWQLAGNFEYILEGKDGISFGNAWTGPVLVAPDNSDYKFAVASHGHLPCKGAQPVFIMSGPDIQKEVVIPRQRVIDEAPTFARILGTNLPSAQGRVLEEFLK